MASASLASLHAQAVGGASFTAATQKLGTAVNPQSIAVGDYDGDGIPDLVVGSNGFVSVLLGNGDGTFKPANNISALADNHAVAMAAFQNGKPKDILAISNATSSANDAALILGDGTSTVFSLPFGSASSVATGDVNGDGNQDFVVALANSVVVYLGKGNGTFQSPTIFPIADAGEFVALANLTGHGHLDIAVATSGNAIDVFENDGSGNFSQAPGATLAKSPAGLAAADFNGDGIIDLAVANTDGTVSILLGNGDGSYKPATTVSVGTNPSGIVVGDFNGDGKADLAVTNSGDNSVTVLLGNGDGTFEAPITVKTDVAPSALAVGDFKGNGVIDLAAANSTGNSVSIILTQHTGSSVPTPTPTPTPTPPPTGGSGSGSTRLINISTLAQVGTGGNILIPGFVIGGSGTETLLIRGGGPSLAEFNVAGFLLQPTISVFSGQTQIASNTGWTTNANPALITSTAAQVGAYAYPAGSADSALIVTLSAGAYTVKLSGVDNTTGTGIAEVYEVASTGTARLINIATLAQVGKAPNLLVPGFVISGSGSEQLLVRGDGPSLAQFNVTGFLANPSLTVTAQGGAVITTNTGWETSANPALISSTEAAVGAFTFPAGSADSAAIVTLQPGAYTMQISGVGGTTGTGLAEVYEVK